MSTQTSALPDGTTLTKPAASERVSLSVINTNTDNIANNIIGVNDKITGINLGTFSTLSALESALDTLGTSMAVRNSRTIWVQFSTNASPFSSTGYSGTFYKVFDNRYRVVLYMNANNYAIEGAKTTNGWIWDSLASGSQLGDFQYVYMGGLGHISGETLLDKFKRAYQANAFPISKPFFGYISAGSQLLVMGYLYMSNNQLYGSGYIASYDGTGIIRVQAGSWTDLNATDSQSTTVTSGSSTVVYRKMNGIVHVRVRYDAGADGEIAAWQNKALTTLPVGYRPPIEVTVRGGCDREDASKAATVTVTVAGTVRVESRWSAIAASSGNIIYGNLEYVAV